MSRYLDLARQAMRNAPPDALLRGTPASDAGAPEEARREPGRLLALDEDRLRRHEERRQRMTSVLAERFCPACGFSFWRVSPQGDASCYACTLLRQGRPLRCARCGLEEWRRDEHGRRVCASCHGGDTRGSAPVEIASPEPTSREFPAPRGTA